MKNNKVSFETRFLAGFKTKNPFSALNAVFDFAHVDYYKDNLTQAVLHCYTRKVYKQEAPCNVFVFQTALCSYVRMCYWMLGKSRKWKVKEPLSSETVFYLSSLTKEERDNPYLVFENAFEEISLKHFEFFINEVTELSLSPFGSDPDSDFTTPYIHLIKLLDAGELIHERGIEKNKKRPQNEKE